MRNTATILVACTLASACTTAFETEAVDANPALARCEAVQLDLVVGEFDGLWINGVESDLDDLRQAAREKAAACDGVTPTGTYEGPGYVTVISSMIWPILDEELPDLELEDRIRRPGGRGSYEG